MASKVFLITSNVMGRGKDKLGGLRYGQFLTPARGKSPEKPATADDAH